MERHLFHAQRISALLLAPLVLVHVGLILWAVRDGLSAEEILSRTEGSLVWAIFYGAFVVAVTVHAPIGLRNVLTEWTALPRRVIDAVSILTGLVLLALGLRAVWIVTL